jgi:hypothetical protein
MPPETVHISDQDLLSWIDGELSAQHASKVKLHIRACWTCRTRVAELEQAITEFVQLHRQESDGRIPPIEGPRSLLRARLAEQHAPSSARTWFGGMTRVAAAIAIVVFLTGIAALRYHTARVELRPWASNATPNLALTPGATVPVSVHDVCSGNLPANDPAVPDPLKQQVLQEYGLANVSNTDYQIDYLVTPKLGGAANIRNLWPEPSVHTPWNAHVKDVLEDRLNYLVCSGQLDLATAQHEVSTDWVAAYKKYFRTNEPIQEHFGRRALSMRRSSSMFRPLLASVVVIGLGSR